MAREFKLLTVLLLLVACLAYLSTTTGSVAMAEPVVSSTLDPSTTNETVSTVTPDPSTTNETVPTVSPDPTTTNETVPTATPGQNTSTEAALTTPGSPAPTKLPDPCDPNPCGDGSTCEPRADQNYECFCLTGEKYNNQTKTCDSARVFPGQLSLSTMTFVKDMADNKSEIFLKTSDEIISVLDKAYTPLDGYSGSLVLKLSDGNQKKTAWSREGAGVNAEIEITFEKNSEVTLEDVNKTMVEKVVCEGCGLEGTFTAGDLCDNACDKKSMTCTSADGTFSCSCLKTHIEIDFTDRVCIACSSGFQAVDNDCVPCSFGRSGFNCTESWKLVLVIVGSVLGGLLLITIILLPIVARKSSKKSSKKEKKDKKADTENAYVNQPPPKRPLVDSSFANSQAAPGNGQASGLSAFANAGVPRIPRASANSWDSRTNLEMTPSNSRQNLISTGRRFDDHEDMNRFGQARPQSSLYAQARPQSNLYAQTRPQTNPYAQNRPQSNPYAQSQGNSNPYYMPDDDRRFN